MLFAQETTRRMTYALKFGNSVLVLEMLSLGIQDFPHRKGFNILLLDAYQISR